MTLYVNVICGFFWIQNWIPFFQKSYILIVGLNYSLLTPPSEEQYFFLKWHFMRGERSKKWLFVWPICPSLLINQPHILLYETKNKGLWKKLHKCRKLYETVKVKASKTIIKKCRRQGADCSPVAISPVLFVCVCTCVFVYVHFSLRPCPSVTRNYRFIIQHGLVSTLTLAWGTVCEHEAEESRLERPSTWWHKVKKIKKLNPKETITSFTFTVSKNGNIEWTR